MKQQECGSTGGSTPAGCARHEHTVGQDAAGAPVPLPTNRGTGNCNVLRYGVDSLYLSYSGELRDEWIIPLEEARENAQSPDELKQAKAQVSILDHRFEVASGGSKLYRYRLSDAAYSIQLSRRRRSQVPVAYVQIRSQWLTAVGVDQAVAQLGSILRAMVAVNGEPNISRVDLFVDFVSLIAPDSWTTNAWVTRARSLATYYVDQQFSGWTVGKGGALSARLYDKTRELLTSKKDYLKPLWADAGWLPSQPVYRLEFQFRNEVLKELGLRGYSGLAGQAGGLWRYSMTDWLRLTVPNALDATKARWPTHPLWSELAELCWEGFAGAERVPLIRDRAPSLAAMLRFYEAAVTSYMAAHGITDPAVAAEELMGASLAQTGQVLREAVGVPSKYKTTLYETAESRLRARAARKAKEFNLLFPDDVSLDEASVKEAARLAYLRATGRE